MRLRSLVILVLTTLFLQGCPLYSCGSNDVDDFPKPGVVLDREDYSIELTDKYSKITVKPSALPEGTELLSLYYEGILYGTFLPEPPIFLPPSEEGKKYALELWFEDDLGNEISVKEYELP